MSRTKTTSSVLTTLLTERPPGSPPERVIRAGEAFWEPGGDVIHYQAANNLADSWSRFVVMMMCEPDQPMPVYVDDSELELCRDRRAPRGMAS